MAARIDSLKDEMDDALNKVEMCKVGSVYPQSSQVLFIRLGSDLDILFLGEERGLCNPGTLLGTLSVKVRAPSGVHLSLRETFLCVTTLFYHLCTCTYLIYISIYLLTLQDQLSADMYSFASKEADYARYYVMVSTFTLSDTEF